MTVATPGPGAEPAPDRPARRRPTRDAPGPNVVGIVILATAALVAVLVTFGVFLPAIGALGDAAAGDRGAPPGSILLCEREWRRAEPARALTRDEVFARTDAEPIVVEVSPFAACPQAVGAPGGDPDGMATVVYVQTGRDAFVGYELVGGP